MNLKMAITRAKRGFREDFKLYLVAVSSLTVAFLCLATSLLAIENLGALAESWGESRRMTVYLVDGAQPDDIEQLVVLLDGLPEVAAVAHLTSAEARREFIEQSDVGGAFDGLPADAFPASLEVTLAPGTSTATVGEIAARIGRLNAVDEVEAYAGWFSRLDQLVETGKGLAGALAILVVICVLAVVGNTIRLAVASRRDEIEVMKLCGATDSFVRGPFLVEGAFSGFAAALLAILLLGVGFLVLRGELDSTLSVITGTPTVFLDPITVVVVLVGATLAGAAGSTLSLRRYLAV